MFWNLLNSNINKNNIIIKRNVPIKNTYLKNHDDWEISQEIIDKYEYNERSNQIFYKTNKSDINDLSIFKDLKNLILGNCKICDYSTPTYDKPIFHIIGIYGDRTHLGDFSAIKQYLNHKKK